jgi:hypothetical protein
MFAAISSHSYSKAPILTFYFTIREVRKSPDYPDRTTQYGLGRPTKPLGSNIFEPTGDHDYKVYYFDGSQVSELTIEAFAQVIQSGAIEQFKTASMFYNFTASRFWCIDFDATQNPVGDGLNYDNDPEDSNDSEDDDEEETPMDWMPLGFTWPRTPHNPDQPTGMSTIEITGWTGNAQLYMTRQGQRWPERLLPPNYQPIDQRFQNLAGYQPPYGSLNGDLAVLIALVGFTARPDSDYVDSALKRCIRGTRWVHPSGGNTGCKFFILKSNSIITVPNFT